MSRAACLLDLSCERSRRLVLGGMRANSRPARSPVLALGGLALFRRPACAFLPADAVLQIF
jgi:hypothetical protein